MGIFRKALVICAVIAVVPLPADEALVASAENPGTFGYLSAATEAYSDAKGFCSRQPTVCGTATYVAYTMEAKARYAARFIFSWASGEDEKPALRKKSAKTTLVTADAEDQVLAIEAVADDKAKTINDLLPELRGTIYEDDDKG